MASSVFLLRILLQDPSGVDEILVDSDYDAIVELEPNAYRAAAMAARVISAKYADRIDIDAGSSSMKLSQQVNHYLKLAEDFDRRAQRGGDGGTGVSGPIASGGAELTGISVEEIQNSRDDSDRYDSVFYRGLNDNPSNNNDDSDY